MDETHVVTVFLRNGADVLLLKRSDEVGSYPGQWGGVAGHAEGDPAAAARREIREETGVDSGQVALVRAGEPFPVDDPEHGRWVVHPYLFDCATRDVETDWETVEHDWTAPTDILHRETVPDLWTSYERVAPTVETVTDDTEHGSAYISLRALEVLRDRAAVLATGREAADDEWAALANLARDIHAARPSMQVVTNRVNRVMHEADDRADARRAGDVEEAASRVIEAALGADAAAARNAADRLDGVRVLTLSRSGTVLAALRQANPAEVLIAESRPAREGVGVAEELAAESIRTETGTDVTLLVDAAVAHVLATRDVDAVLVGADAVLADGRVVNKVGTRATALAAAREDVPTYAVAARDKIAPHAEPNFEEDDPREVYDGNDTGDSDAGDGDAGGNLSVLNPTFDATPPDLLVGVVTEDGLLDAEDVADVAAEMATLTEWG